MKRIGQLLLTSRASGVDEGGGLAKVEGQLRPSISIAGLLLVISMAGCATPLSTSAVDPWPYWADAEYRIGYWLSWHPDCPPIVGGVPARPVINGVFERPMYDNRACEYSPDDRTIHVDPSYVSGCMAHELGHAALHQIGNSCWRNYEHDLGEAKK